MSNRQRCPACPAWACINCHGSGYVWHKGTYRCPVCGGDGIDPDYYAEWSRRGEDFLAIFRRVRA